MKTVAPVVEKHYQLIMWVLPKLAKFPRDQRFLLGDRIERHLLDVLEMLIRAMYTKDKRPILLEVNLRLDLLRFLMRMAKDFKFINLKGHDFFARSLIEVGRMVGGWLKALAMGQD